MLRFYIFVMTCFSVTLSVTFSVATLAAPASANTILLATSKTDSEQFESEKMARSDAIAWRDFQLSILRKKAAALKLGSLFTKARAYELAGRTDAAIQIFQKIADQRFSADWDVAERKMVHISLLKLAEFSTLEKTRAAFLRDADGFAVEEFSHDNGDDKRANSRLIAELDRVRVRTVLVNGRRYEPDAIELPTGTFKITFITDWSEPETMVLDKAKLQNLKLTLTPLLRGDCKHGFHWRTLTPPTKDVWAVGPDCALPMAGNATTVARQSGPDTSATSLADGLKAPHGSTIFKKIPTWAWWGLGLLGAAAIVQSQNSHSSNEGGHPTTKRGF